MSSVGCIPYLRGGKRGSYSPFLVVTVRSDTPRGVTGLVIRHNKESFNHFNYGFYNSKDFSPHTYLLDIGR